MVEGVVAPSGTVTFVFTDIEGSTGLWERDPVGMQEALELHDQLVSVVFADHGGHVFAATGDGFAAAFSRPDAALAAAVALQTGLAAQSWPLAEGVLRVRVGLHTGTSVEREGNYFGPAVNIAARVMGLAAGGQVLLSAVCAGLLDPAAGVAVASVGTHGLAGVDRPVELFVAVGAGLVVDVPAGGEIVPVSVSAPPRYATSFVGRDAELGSVVELVRRPGLVTIVGAGGMGKTRLAVEATNRAGEREHVWFCDLAALSEPAAVAHQVAAVVGAKPPRGGAEVLDAVVEALASVDGVLVLDNCEHVLDAAGRVAQRVVSRCSAMTVLATSRAPLAVAEECRFPLGGLDPSGAGAELLAERVRATAPELGPEALDDETMETLCRALDGMPLAIELAAAQTRMLSPAELVAHLDERFELLRSTSPDRPGRHRSVEAAVAWSYERLTDPARRLLEVVATFAGTVDLELVRALWAAVGEPGRPTRALAELVDRSMVLVDRGGSRTRFGLLETVRAFVREVGDESERLRVQHASVIRERFDKLTARFTAPGGGDCVADIAEYWAELRAATRTAIDARDVALAAALLWRMGFPAFASERAELRDWVDQIEQLPGFSGEPNAAGVLGAGSMIDWITGRYDVGDRRWRAARGLIAQGRSRWGAEAAMGAVQHTLVLGEVELARQTGAQAVLEARDHGDEFGRLVHGLSRVQIETMTGHTALGQEILADLEADIDHYDNTYLHAFRCHSTTVAWLDDDPHRALAAAQEGSRLAQAHSFPWHLGALGNYTTTALIRIGDPAEALDALRASIERIQAGASVQSVTNTVRNAVVLCDRHGLIEIAAPLVGWLDANPAGIPGTPGMRDLTQTQRTRLTDILGDHTATEAMATGAQFTTQQAITHTITSVEAIVRHQHGPHASA